MKLFSKEVKIGLMGVVALLLLFLGINFLKGVNLFKPSNNYYIAFSDVKGLAQSSPVFANGYSVGIVRDIIYDYNRPNNVLVEISVNDNLRIPQGSTARLDAEMLGGCTLRLMLAANSTGNYTPGDTIPGSDSQGLMEKAGEMLPQVELIVTRMDSLLYTLNRLAADPNLPLILQNAEQMTAQLNATSVQLNALMHKDVPQLASKFNTIGDNVIRLTDSLNRIDLQTTVAQLNSTLANLKQMSAQLNSKDNTVGLLLNDPALYNNLNQTINSANSLLQDLQQHPKRYVHFSLFGKKDK